MILKTVTLQNRPRSYMFLIFFTVMTNVVIADEMRKTLIIDDRSNTDVKSNLGSQWNLITDGVMGGLSQGQLLPVTFKGKKCLRLRGEVTTENNGGFVQMSLPLSDDDPFDASSYSGIEFEIAGNNESYNIHLRTNNLWFPWQSYRSSFIAGSEWKTYRIPFSKLEKYKTFHSFSAEKLERIGIVAIGRNFEADLCLASINFYHD